MTFVTVLETESYLRCVEHLFTDEERQDIISLVARNPDAGVLIKGTGGLRKLRVAAKGKGKRGGARVIYFFYDLHIPVSLLAAYGKGEKDDLSRDDLAKLAKVTDAIVRAFKERPTR